MIRAGSRRVFNYDGATSIPDAAKFRAHDGQTVRIIERLRQPEVDDEVVMFRVEFPDGWRAHVWLDEIEPAERRPGWPGKTPARKRAANRKAS